MAWTTLSFPFGSLLTSTKMTQMYDNLVAFANKSSGAPTLAANYIVSGMLMDSAVSVAKLKLSLGSYYSAVSITTYISTGVLYVHQPRVTISAASDPSATATITDQLTQTGDGSTQTQFYLVFTASNAQVTVYWDSHLP